MSNVWSLIRWFILQDSKQWRLCQQLTPCWRLFVKVKDQRPNDKTMCEMDHTNGSSFSHSFTKTNYPQIMTASLSWDQCSGFEAFSRGDLILFRTDSDLHTRVLLFIIGDGCFSATCLNGETNTSSCQLCSTQAAVFECRNLCVQCSIIWYELNVSLSQCRRKKILLSSENKY